MCYTHFKLIGRGATTYSYKMCVTQLIKKVRKYAPAGAHVRVHYYEARTARTYYSA